MNAEDWNLCRNNLLAGVSPDGIDSEDMRDFMQILVRLDMDLAYPFKKLLNLNIFLIHQLTGENDGAAPENNSSLVDLNEKALASEYLSGILDCEIRELQGFINALQTEIKEARHNTNILSDVSLREHLNDAEQKLHDCNEYLKQSQENVLKMKTQSEKMQRASLASQHDNRRNFNGLAYSDNGHFPSENTNSGMQISVKRLLEDSLRREQDLEKKISELRQDGEELKLKIHSMEEEAFRMEKEAETVFGRLLEAENAAAVLMGTSKELIGEVQLAQNNISVREKELKSRWKGSTEQSKDSEMAMLQFESSEAENAKLLEAEVRDMIDCKDELYMDKKIKLLEKQLQELALQLEKANASGKLYAEHLNEAEHVVKSLKERVSIAESRSESAEAKILFLTETNLELTEEVGFLKGGSINADRVSLLEKNLTECEVKLQQAEASSERSQQQQIMLYSAILDMETLISDLKSKVSVAESKLENAEEQCDELSGANLKLNEEVRCLRFRMESLETSLRQSNTEKVNSAEDINTVAKLMMDMVKQLQFERGIIQKQLLSSIKDNKNLMENLKVSKTDICKIVHQASNGDTREFVFPNQDLSNSNGIITSKEPVAESSEISIADG